MGLTLTGRAGAQPKTGGAAPAANPYQRTDAEWRKTLTPEQFKVLRTEGTEFPHSSPLNKETRKGTYLCVGCELPLFSSAAKYDSGTGWPSFFDKLQGGVEPSSKSSAMFGTEYHCSRCGGHHGHIFADGPKPTGVRYCSNGVALKFVAA